jgi:periplasmic copper chaperone A
MRWPSFLLTLLLSTVVHAAALSVKDAYVPEPPPGQTMAAMFMTVTNPLSQPLALVAATSPLASRVEFHTHVHANGLMKMQALSRVELIAKSDTEFKPGGLHLMLFGLKRALKAGEDVPVTLSLSDGSKLQAVGRVRDLRR